jgi:hypothetical protein
MQPNGQPLVLSDAIDLALPEVFLPFDGDPLFNRILRRAMFLAQDAKITNKGLLKQIDPLQ